MFNNRRSIIRRAVMHSLGIAALAMMFTPAAQAIGLSNPGSAAAAQPARDALVTHVRGGHGGGHGGGGRGGGGFHGGGGFRGGGHAFHGGGFRGGGFRAAPAFRGGGFARRSFHVGAPYYAHRRPYYRHRYFGPRYYGYGLSYHYGPRRFCRVVWTHYGPRKICRYRPWHHHHWRRHYRVYW